MICDLKWPRTGPVVLLSLEAGGLSLLMAALYLPTISFLDKDSIPPGLSCWDKTFFVPDASGRPSSSEVLFTILLSWSQFPGFYLFSLLVISPFVYRILFKM